MHKGLVLPVPRGVLHFDCICCSGSSGAIVHNIRAALDSMWKIWWPQGAGNLSGQPVKAPKLLSSCVPRRTWLQKSWCARERFTTVRALYNSLHDGASLHDA